MCEGIAKGTGFPTDNRAPKLFEGKNALGTWWKLYQGDALEALKLIEDQTVDCVVTSPPYFWLRDYGIEGQIGLERTVEEYVAAVNSVMLEVRRILKTTGTLFVNLGDTYYSGKGKSHGKDKKSKKRRFGLRAVDKSGGLDIGFQRKSMIRIRVHVCQE
jgi:DNA modification methylase